MAKKVGLITNFRELTYNPKLKERAREMRNNSIKGEIKFWCELLKNKKSGYQFYRQKIIHHYIINFYCAKLKLVIKIDGTSHKGKEEYDDDREKLLNSLELKVLHYNDLMVLNNFHLVEKDFKRQIAIREEELGIKKVSL